MSGRPAEHRVKLTIHVKKATAAKIRRIVAKSDKRLNTNGKVVDEAVADFNPEKQTKKAP